MRKQWKKPIFWRGREDATDDKVLSTMLAASVGIDKRHSNMKDVSIGAEDRCKDVHPALTALKAKLSGFSIFNVRNR